MKNSTNYKFRWLSVLHVPTGTYCETLVTTTNSAALKFLRSWFFEIYDIELQANEIKLKLEV